MTQFYRVILNGMIKTEVRGLETFIELSNCETYYRLQVDTVDVCNNVIVGVPVQFLCPQIGKQLVNTFFVELNIYIFKYIGLETWVAKVALIIQIVLLKKIHAQKT